MWAYKTTCCTGVDVQVSVGTILQTSSLRLNHENLFVTSETVRKDTSMKY